MSHEPPPNSFSSFNPSTPGVEQATTSHRLFVTKDYKELQVRAVQPSQNSPTRLPLRSQRRNAAPSLGRYSWAVFRNLGASSTSRRNASGQGRQLRLFHAGNPWLSERIFTGWALKQQWYKTSVELWWHEDLSHFYVFFKLLLSSAFCLLWFIIVFLLGIVHTE